MLRAVGANEDGIRELIAKLRVVRHPPQSDFCKSKTMLLSYWSHKIQCAEVGIIPILIQSELPVRIVGNRLTYPHPVGLPLHLLWIKATPLLHLSFPRELTCKESSTE